jgi:hypothetical protein
VVDVARASSPRVLACCHGYVVAAGDLEIGEVETPIFAGPLSEPDYLLVRTVGSISGTFRIVPTTLVTDIDEDRQLVAIASDHDAVAALPERLPVRIPRVGSGAS